MKNVIQTCGFKQVQVSGTAKLAHPYSLQKRAEICNCSFSNQGCVLVSCVRMHVQSASKNCRAQPGRQNKPRGAQRIGGLDHSIFSQGLLEDYKAQNILTIPDKILKHFKGHRNFSSMFGNLFHWSWNCSTSWDIYGNLSNHRRPIFHSALTIMNSILLKN